MGRRPWWWLALAMMVNCGGAQSELQVWQTCQATGDLLTAHHQPHARWQSKASAASAGSSVATVEVLGWGGAFTGAAAANFWKLSDAQRQQVLRAYWGDGSDGGNAYTLGRVPIGSCDFDPESYTFDDVANDTALQHFDRNVTHDQRQLLPFIRAAQRSVSQRGRSLRVLGSPWSPPAWMKVPVEGVQSVLSSAKPNGLLPQFQSAWARYLSLWVTAYEAQGIPVWGITAQNEAEYAAPHESCLFTPSYMREFIQNHLGPTLRREHPSLKLLGFDHNKDTVAQWARELYSHPESAQYVDGLGVHWYMGTFFDNLQEAHDVDPSKLLVATETCDCPVMMDEAWSWNKAERQAADIMGDLASWVVAWLDWNLLVDENGGPSHMGWNCGAAIVTDHTNRHGRGTVVLQPSYYYTGHFSRWVEPGMAVVQTTVELNDAVKNVQSGEWGLMDSDRVAMFPCDGGSRQRWELTDAGQLRLMVDAGGATSTTKLCLTVPEGTLLAWSELVLAPCDDQSLEQQLMVQPAEDAGSDADAAADGWVRLLTLGSQGEHCVRLDWLHLQADRPVFQYAVDGSAVDLWRLNATDGSVRTAVDERWCVTAGARPILRAVAATDDSRSQLTTVVVLNRAAHAQPFELVDADLAVTLRGLSAPAHSMLTLRYNASDVLRATEEGSSPGEETQAAAAGGGEVWASGVAWGFGMASMFWIGLLAVIGGVVGVAMRKRQVRSPNPPLARC